jgi:hypothetical protein
MAVVGRIAYQNRVQARETILFPSSQLTSLPVGFLRDQLPSKPWRSLSGWTIVAGFNDRLDWNRGGVRTCTLTAGNYGNGADMAAEIQARMAAADGGASYTCTYDVNTFKFTIGCSVSITILWLTGANAAASVGECLGYVVSADTASAASHTAANLAYQSRHFIKANLGSAMSGAVGIVWAHNAGTGGTFTHQSNATDAWSLPTRSVTLAGDATIRIGYYSSATLQWRRLLINDVQNTLGYSEIGIWFDGPHTQPSVLYSDAFSDAPQELSAIGFSTHGAHIVDPRPIRHVWNLEWREVPEADRTLLEAFEAATPCGTNFFFSFDATDNPADTLYGFRAQPMAKAFVPSAYWNLSFPFAEALE